MRYPFDPKIAGRLEELLGEDRIRPIQHESRR